MSVEVQYGIVPVVLLHIIFSQRHAEPSTLRMCTNAHMSQEAATHCNYEVVWMQVAIIPARYQSSRFPGKPLVKIAGKLMIQRTWEQACKATSITDVYVATDDQRIADACHEFSANVILTSADCPNGTVRCAEAVRKLPKKYDLVLNLQGDEPLLEPEVIDAVVLALQDADAAVCDTSCAVPMLLDSWMVGWLYDWIFG
jgi:GTP:adenosylcobinamide-phosphate guanylyltransferase